MDGMLIRICGVALLCTVAGQILGRLRGEFSSFVRIAGILLLFGTLVSMVYGAFGEIGVLFEQNGIDTYVDVMLRALGIALLTRICTDLCRDCGEATLAGGVEIAGKLAILWLCFPLIGEILGYARKILEQE